MRRYNIVPLILLILSTINFALAAPVLIPENSQVRVDVVRVLPKDVITVLGKRGDELEKMVKLFENFDRWWGRNPGSSSAGRPPSSSAQLESGHVPPASPASSTESDWDPESLVWHPPTPSTLAASSTESDSEHESMPSLESVSDPDRESMDVDHDAAPPPSATPESSIASGHLHTLPSSPEWSTESEHWYTPASSAESLFENSQTANDELKGKAKVSRRITGTARGAANLNAARAQSELQYV
jgi:hypothetical protein